MEEGVFEREVLGRAPSFRAWVQLVTGERRGEAPYELLCAWRRAFCVPSSVPYETCALVDVPDVGFYLRTTSSAGRVLLFAHAEMRRVSMYHPTELALEEWGGWQDARVWPWPASYRNAPAWYTMLPPELFRMLFITYLDASFIEEARFARMPLCKRWMAFWESEWCYWSDDIDAVVASFGNPPWLTSLGRKSRWAVGQRILQATLDRVWKDETIARAFVLALESQNPGISVEWRRNHFYVTEQGGQILQRCFPHVVRLQCVVLFKGHLVRWLNGTAK